MTDVLIRSVVSELDVAGDGRTLTGLVCPYNTPTEVDDGFGPYREAIHPDAFRKVMQGRPSFVRLLLEHGGQWVGRGERWLSSDEGLRMSFRIDDTEPGRTAIYKVKDQQVPGLSIGYVPGRTVTKPGPDGPVEWRMTIRSLHHTALVATPAYDQARVTAVRHASVQTHDRLSDTRQWLATHTPASS